MMAKKHKHMKKIIQDLKTEFSKEIKTLMRTQVEMKLSNPAREREGKKEE